MSIICPKCGHRENPVCSDPFHQRVKSATGPWRPFSEAPKDGTEILVQYEIGGRDLLHWSTFSNSWRTHNGYQAGITATHFAIINEVSE